MSQPMYVRRTRYGDYAGIVSRLAAVGIDAAIVAVILSMTTIGFNTFLQFVTLVTFFDPAEWLRNNLTIPFTIPALLLALIPPITFALYEILFIAAVGRTPGKAIIGLAVVNRRGDHPSLFRAFLRAPGKYISAAALLLGFFWIIIDPQRQGWHDKIARTWVVYAWRNARADETFLLREVQVMPPPDHANKPQPAQLPERTSR